MAAIHWELKGKTLQLKLTVPKGSTATLSLPKGWKTAKKSFAAGTHKVVAKA